MEYELLGWPPDGPKLRLDHERFSYAGKFVMTNTGKAVARDDAIDHRSDARSDDNRRDEEPDPPIVAAVSFNEDRTDEETLWLRYVTVDRDRRGEGIGPELLGHVRDRALERGYERLRIAVNNPFAYEALYRTGFGYTGETTGIAELILEHPRPDEVEDQHDEGEVKDEDLHDDERASQARYQAGLDRFRERDLSDEEVAFLEKRRESEPPGLESRG